MAKKNLQQFYIEELTRLTKTWTITSETGYQPISNCWGIFTYSENEFSVENMKEACEHYFNEFKKLGYKFMTEFVLVMNHKTWQHHGKNDELGKLYNEYYHKSAQWCEENFSEEGLEYYYKTTD